MLRNTRGGQTKSYAQNRTIGQVPKNDEADTVPHLPIVTRSITMSSAVISSPEAAEVPRGWTIMSRSTDKPQQELCEDEVKNRSLHVKNRSLAKS